MVFSSLLFIFAFLPVVWVGFHLLKSEQFAKICDKFCAKFHLFIKPYTLAKLFLIAASLFFYAFWKLAYLPILLASILVNFYLAKRILNVNFSSNALQNALAQNGGGGDNPSNQSTLKSANQTHFKPKFYFIIGVIFNLCLLGFFKYTDFFLENFNTFAKLAHLDFDIPLPHILLPLALSFVTFQQIAFLYDCYKRTKGQLRENLNMDFIDYALFISFFPQLIAGPIVHHREMMPQFAKIAKEKQTINYEFLAKGIFIFSIGLFKKAFIADSFAKWADAGFSVVEKGEYLNIAESWATSLSYTFQLYFDFSGYCDMAIGLGLMFGIVLPLNFNSPYKSLNIAEFWRRWHITLGRFLTECVYVPLGGNRVSKILNLRNIFIVFFLSGVWHGAGWGFVIWGILHALAMMVHRIYGWWVKSLKLKSKSLQNFANAKSWQSTQICHISEKSKTPNCHIERSEISQTNSQRDFSPTAQNDKMRHFVCNDKKRHFAQNDSPCTMRFLKFTQTRLYKVLCWLFTFNFVSIAWVFFRAENLQGALNLLKGMFGVVWVELPQKWHRMPETLAQIDGRNDTIFYIFISILVCVFCKNSFEFMQNFHSKAFEFSIAIRVFSKKIWLKGGGVFVKFIISIVLFYASMWLFIKALLDDNAYSPFIYFNF